MRLHDLDEAVKLRDRSRALRNASDAIKYRWGAFYCRNIREGVITDLNPLLGEDRLREMMLVELSAQCDACERALVALGIEV